MRDTDEIKFIMRTTDAKICDEYKEDIPNLIVCQDRKHDAMDTFKMSLELAGDCACVNMEDDIILCDDFYNKIIEEIEKRPNEVIQFFSMRKDDLTVGSRYISGRAFCMGQCFYIPKGMAKEVLEYMDRWTRYEEDPTALDYLFADYLKEKKIKYWNVCPNLVDHKPIKSRINPRRSTKRQSLTFKEEK